MSRAQLRPDYYKVQVKATDPKSGEPIEVVVECFDLIDALGLGFYSGNVMKYFFRGGRKEKKGKAQDYKKAATYLDQYLERHGEK